MAMATALSTSLPHLQPRRLPSSPAAAVSLYTRAVRRREAPTRLAAVAAASELLDSTNGAVTAPSSGTASGQQQYGREYFPLAAVVGQVRRSFPSTPSCCHLLMVGLVLVVAFRRAGQGHFVGLLTELSCRFTQWIRAFGVLRVSQYQCRNSNSHTVYII
jgi:hypothetical protein